VRLLKHWKPYELRNYQESQRLLQGGRRVNFVLGFPQNRTMFTSASDPAPKHALRTNSYLCCTASEGTGQEEKTFATLRLYVLLDNS